MNKNVQVHFSGTSIVSVEREVLNIIVRLAQMQLDVVHARQDKTGVSLKTEEALYKLKKELGPAKLST